MKKLKLPFLLPIGATTEEEFCKIANNSMACWKDFIPRYELPVSGFSVRSNIESDKNDYFIYAFIGRDYYSSFSLCGNYYENALVKTDDIHFKTYSEWEKAVKTATKQLQERWKEWVESLYYEEKIDE